MSAPACSTVTQSDLAKREDYLPAMALHAGGNTPAARDAFPAKERGGFITTLERGWLGVVAKDADPDALVKVGRDLEARKTLRVSHEAKAYFYKETEDGYFPAEHEAILFHVVAGLGFLQKGRVAEATVEARKASFYLQNDFGAEAGFDDPALRLWLAALWAGCGDWESARVDLRVAAHASPDHAWAAELAARDTPPKTLALVLAGPGPDLTWTPGVRSGPDAMTFVPGMTGGAFTLGKLSIDRRIATLPWYARHVERDFALRQVMNRSRYMVEGIVPGAAAGAVMTAGVVAGVTVIAASVVGGVAIIYVAVRAGAEVGGDVGGYIIGGGVLAGGSVALLGISGGAKVMEKSGDASSYLLEKGFSPVNAYRYARFLPDLVYLAATDAPLASETLHDAAGTVTAQPFLRTAHPDGSPAVLAYFVPGTGDDLTRAAEKAGWKDPLRHRDWVMLASPRGHLDALKACEAVARRLPTWTELLDARQDGLLNPEANPRFASALKVAGQIWTRDENAAPMAGACRYLDVADFGESTGKDCATVRTTLCVKVDEF